MTERPILLFPSPIVTERTKLHSRPRPLHKPSHDRQSERLSPQFTQLQEVFAERRVEIQQTTAGIDPEMVLVIETIGNIENFANAVKQIPGLEWMGELEEDNVIPDSDFYDITSPEKKINGRLYLVMTNQQALTQMLSLWNRYKENSSMTFNRGLTRFRYLFQYLKDIRYWDVQDRLIDTGVIKAWRKDLEYDGNRIVCFEIELWYRDNEEKRHYSQQVVNDLIQQLGGRVINQCIISEIAYHSLLVELPARAIEEIIAHPDTKLTECEGIMFFRPVGQMSGGRRATSEDLPEFVPSEISLPSGDPIIGILDGLPLANHNLLSNRLIIDDPDNLTSDYTPEDCYHGTAMASLIIHGDLNEESNPLPRPVYIRPIMKPDPIGFPPYRDEIIPDETELGIDLIHRAIRRIFQGDGNEDAVAPSIKIVNLSIGDPSREFTQIMSPLARLLDWLSVQYNVLFIVSAGNHFEPINVDINASEFEHLPPSEREAAVVQALYKDSINRKILSPGESINALTIGSLHYDTSSVNPSDSQIDLYQNLLPSPFSSFGSGYRRAIKPEFVYPGGRCHYRIPTNNGGNISFEANCIIHSPPGNQFATPGRLAGDLTKTAFDRGTSNSAAFISRTASISHDTLIEIFEDQAPDFDYDEYIVPLLKSIIVHGCAWGETGRHLELILDSPDISNSQLKKRVSKWLGYGVLDISKVLNCTDKRATLLGFGQLNDNQAHIFRLPFPPSLGGRRDSRKLTITLAWLSPIVASSQKYRIAQM